MEEELKNAPQPRTAAAIRQQRYRDKKAVTEHNEASQSVTKRHKASHVTGCDAALEKENSPHTPLKETLPLKENPLKGSKEKGVRKNEVPHENPKPSNSGPRTDFTEKTSRYTRLDKYARCPYEELEIPVVWWDIAAAKGRTPDQIEQIWEYFKNWAENSKNGSKLNWQATWRNCIAKGWGLSDHSTGNSSSKRGSANSILRSAQMAMDAGGQYPGREDREYEMGTIERLPLQTE
jgi:hypothetical protein